MFGIRHRHVRSLCRPFGKWPSHLEWRKVRKHNSTTDSSSATTPATTTSNNTAVDVALGLAQAGCLAYLVFNNFLSTSEMLGPSMWPTFRPEGDVVLVEKLSHKQNALAPGDIVTCISPDDPRQSICKRLTALEGMEVAVPFEDPDVCPPLLRTQQYTVHEVPQGHVWLLGDNTQLSHDCRSYGPVPYALLTGRVCAQIWPLDRVRVFPPSSPQNPRQYALELSVSSCK